MKLGWDGRRNFMKVLLKPMVCVVLHEVTMHNDSLLRFSYLKILAGDPLGYF
jgi:hypothetical protein